VQHDPLGTIPANRLLAAVDLGSNSFRLTIARIESAPLGDRVIALASIKHAVRLASGLRADATLDEASRERALVALADFGQRLRSFAPAAVRAVGTSTMRIARDTRDFLRRAESALGFPIEVVSGLEEARLIYLGAAHSLPRDGEPRLVVDIGGGSSECIVGVDLQPKALQSANVGCVVPAGRRFAGRRIDRRSFDAAYREARDAFAPIAAALRSQCWRYAFGTSGTSKSLWQIARMQWGAPALDRASLVRTRDALIAAGDAGSVRLAGLNTDRRSVLAGGLVVMTAVFDELGVDRMHYCDAALREGVLRELLDARRFAALARSPASATGTG